MNEITLKSGWNIVNTPKILTINKFNKPNLTLVFQFSSVAQLCPTLCDPMDWNKTGLPVHHQLPKFTQTHIHWVSEAVPSPKFMCWSLSSQYVRLGWYLGIGVFKEVKEVKVTQSCLTLCNPMDYEVHGILQAKILEWIDFPFSRGSSQPGCRTRVSYIAGGFFTNWAIREVL